VNSAFGGQPTSVAARRSKPSAATIWPRKAVPLQTPQAPAPLRHAEARIRCGALFSPPPRGGGHRGPGVGAHGGKDQTGRARSCGLELG